MHPIALIYDGHCGFCDRWTARMVRATGGRLERGSFHDPLVLKKYGVSHHTSERAVHLLLSDGTVVSGAEATALALSLRRGLGWIRFLYLVPGLHLLAELLYHFVSSHRRELSCLEQKIGLA